MIEVTDIYFLLRGVPATISISILSFFIGFVLGIPLSIIRLYAPKALVFVVEGYENIMRGVPILVIMLFLHFGLGGVIPIFGDPYLSSVIALGLRSGAYQSQIFRGAIGSVGRTQMMAALSLGLSRWKAIRHVILPQAFIVALPGLGSEISLLIKDSSYAFILGVLELTKYADILRKATRSFVIPYVLSAFIYIIITFPIANYLDRLGSKLKDKYGLR